MSTTPFGPHGPHVPANTTTPNPTEQQTHTQIGGEGNAPPVHVYQGSPGNIGIIVVDFIVTLFTLIYFWPFFVCLYPLTGTAVAAATLIARPLIAHSLQPDEESVLFGLLLILAAVVVAIMIRVEYRLAQFFAFRLARHVVRLMLFALIAGPTILWLQPSVEATFTVFLLGFLAQPSLFVCFLMNPVNAGIVAALAVGLHFLLWKADRVRNFWHARLRRIGLK
jgi:hypothetical protein